MAPQSVLVDLEPLDSAVRGMLEDVWRELDALPPIREERAVEYLGIAHGWAGLIYATLQWCSATGDGAPASLAARLAQLTELGSGRGSLRWPQKVPRHQRKHTSMPGWCNGSAGFVFLGTAAAEHLGVEWLTLAERAAMDAWSNSDGVANLCCGLAGRGFALLHLYRVTGSRVWLDRAREVATRAAGRGELGAEGLYKGDAGLALLASGVEDPDQAFMPLFELPRAGSGRGASDPPDRSESGTTRGEAASGVRDRAARALV